MGKRAPIVILNDFSTREGGAGYLANALADNLAQKQYPVTFICGDHSHDNWSDGVTPAPLNQTALLDGSKAAQATRGLYNRTVLKSVRNWIENNDTDDTIYHLHNWSNILSPSIFDALAPVADRCVIHAHDFFLACPNGAFLNFPRSEICSLTPLSASCLTTQCDKRNYPQKLWRSARNAVMENRLRPHLASAQFVLIHNAMRSLLTQNIQPRKISVIGNPVTPFGPPVNAPERQKGIAHIGRVQRLKGVFELAAAGRALNTPINFFGTGEDLDELRHTFPEHIYHGWTSREDLAEHLQNMRAIVIGTQSPEPFCLAAFESLATGLPLIVSRAILAAPELTETGAALDFNPDDAASLKTVLARIIADGNLVAKLAKSARAQPPARTLSEWVGAHVSLYEKVIHAASAQYEEAELVLS